MRGSIQDASLVFVSLSTWGALYLLIAASQAATVLLVSAHRDNGPFSGALAGMASAILTLISIGAYPLWSVRSRCSRAGHLQP